MPANERLSARPKNWLLALLPDEDFSRLRPHLKRVPLRSKQVLQKCQEPIHYIYFPNGGVVSVTTVFSNGATVEVALVGDEGMLGIEVLFSDTPTAAGERMTQVADTTTDAERLSLQEFRRELARRGALYHVAGHYAQAKLAEIFQTAGCHALHRVGQRCARWLLMAQDRMHRADFDLSHESLATMLAVSRPTVSEVAGALQGAGLIRYSHGHVTVLDRNGLEAASCECYAAIRTAFDKFAEACRNVA